MARQFAAPSRWPPAALYEHRIPQKAFNIRRNPKISLLFSDPTGSGLSDSGVVMIRGDAVAEDRVIADMTSSSELGDLMRIVTERQPSSKFMSSFAGTATLPVLLLALGDLRDPSARILLAHKRFRCTTRAHRLEGVLPCGIRPLIRSAVFLR
jgi:hypothetical protein